MTQTRMQGVAFSSWRNWRSTARRCAGGLLVSAGLLAVCGAAGCSELSLSGPKAAPTTQEAPAVAPSGVGGLSESELALWNDPQFKRQFAQSYMAETEIEPPGLTGEEREIMLKVQELLAANKIDEAARLLEKHRGKNASALFDFMLGNIYYQREQAEPAVAAYRAAVEKHAKFRRAWRNMGMLHVRQREFDKALPALTRVVELGGGDALTYGLLGVGYSSVGNSVSAESSYRMAILLDPATLDWKLGLADSLQKQERFADVVALCGRLIAERPDNAKFWQFQARAYIGLNQPLKAAENFEVVDRLGQATAEDLNTLGDIYVNEGIADMAVDCYIRALAQDAKAPAARAIQAAKVMIARNALAETRQLLEQVEKLRREDLKPAEHKDLLRLRARIAVAEGAGDQEVALLKEIVEIDPLDGDALLLLGQYYGRASNAEQAIFYFERAAAIEKYEADAKVRHAQVLIGQKRPEEALPLLRRAQAIKPRDNVQQYLEQVERLVAKARQ